MREARAANLLASMSARQSSMMSRQVLLALTTPPGQRPRAGRFPISARRAGWLIFFGALAFAAASVVSAWWEAFGYDWLWFWASLAIAALVIWLLPPDATSSTNMRPPAEAEALRAAAIARDQTRAPRAAIQPSAAARPVSLMTRPLDALPLHAFANFPSVVILTITIGAQGVVERQALGDGTWQLKCLSALLMLFGIALGLWLALDLLPMRITADERGLRWGRVKRRAIRWDEVRALCQFDLPESVPSDGQTALSRRVYWVASERDIITWSQRLTPARRWFGRRAPTVTDPASAWTNSRVAALRRRGGQNGPAAPRP